MDTAQWPQGIGVGKTSMEVTRKGRPHKDETPLNCPRCNSTNTKFCYYNNYNLSQPRYFCKTCRRYWTVGGSLRNVPVGGGSRKHKRLSSSSSTSTSTIPIFSNPKIINQGQDLNLSYPSSNDHNQHDYNSYNHLKFIELPPNPSSNTTISSNPSRGGLLSPSFMLGPVSDSSNTTSMYNSPLGFGMQDFKPTLNFPLDGFENGYGNSHQGVPQNGASSARLLFPYEELKLQVSSTNEFDDQNRSSSNNNGDGSSTGYWINGNNAIVGGGSW